MEAMGSCVTNNTIEGFPGARFADNVHIPYIIINQPN